MMSPETKRNIYSGLISFGTTLAVAFIIFGMTRGNEVKDRALDELNKKASVEYVDKCDGQIKSELKDFKVEQEKRHENEAKTIDEKLDLILEIVKANNNNKTQTAAK